MRLTTLASLALLLGSCDADSISSLHGAHEFAITQGMPSTSERGLVVFAGTSGLWCSGTVIGDRVVLTAAHCIVGTHRIELLSASAQISGGFAEGSTRFDAHALEVIPHPDFDANSFAHDIGMVVLDQAVPDGVLRATLSRTAPALDAQLLVAGFGATRSDAGAEGARETTSRVAELTATRMSVVPDPGQPCSGDSGGPGFASDDSLAGVISVGDSACNDHSYLMRVDAYLEAFIAPTLASLAEGETLLGERCYDDTQCSSGLCFLPSDAVRTRYCSAPCADESACAAQQTCVRDAQVTRGDKECRLPRPSPGSTGAACTEDAVCESNLCDRVEGLAASQCLSPCVPGVVECGEGAACVPLLGRTFLRACTTPVMEVRDGGCAVRRNTRGTPVCPLLTLLLLGLRRRRSARARRSLVRA